MSDKNGYAFKKLGDKCSHPEPQPFEWEHDNGYGRQSKMPGLLCDLCGKRNLWPGMSTRRQAVVEA